MAPSSGDVPVSWANTTGATTIHPTMAIITTIQEARIKGYHTYIVLFLLCRRGCSLFRFHMTAGTVRERECHPVMAPSAIFSRGYFGHCHIRITPCLHLKDLNVAIRAGQP